MYKKDSSLGNKALVLKTLSESEEFADLIPGMVFIPDTVFGTFLEGNTALARRIDTWLSALESRNYDQAEEEFEEIKTLVLTQFPAFLHRRLPDLIPCIQEKIGIEKKVIIRSSGYEDREDFMNAGGYRSIPDVDISDIYEGIAEVAVSYFSPDTAMLLHAAQKRMESTRIRCPVFIQEMIGTTQKEMNLQAYPVMESGTLRLVADRIRCLQDFFHMPVDTEWVIKQGEQTASVVGFSKEPYMGTDCVYLLCSMGAGSAVRRTAVVNASHYLIPYYKSETQNIVFHSPESLTSPFLFEDEATEIKLVQCRPEIIQDRKIQVNQRTQQYVEEKDNRYKTYEIQTIILGKGDTDGRFLICETVSEAWDEYIRQGNAERYAGCIVRSGAALEHAGIMFAERKIPVVLVSAQAYTGLAMNSEGEYILCHAEAHILIRKDVGEQGKKTEEYRRGECANISLPFRQARVYFTEDGGKGKRTVTDAYEMNEAEQTKDAMKRLIQDNAALNDKSACCFWGRIVELFEEGRLLFYQNGKTCTLKEALAGEQISALSLFYRDNGMQNENPALLQKLLYGENTLIALKQYQALADKRTFGIKDLKKTADRWLMSPRAGKFAADRFLNAFFILAFYGGAGDVELLRNAEERTGRLIDFLNRLEIGRIGEEVNRIFEEHEKGVLDPDILTVRYCRQIILKDLEVIENAAVLNESAAVYKNIAANLTNMVIELLDLEGKSYANSLAMGIYSVAPAYLAHLEEWNRLLGHILIRPGDPYEETAQVVYEKLNCLKEKPNRRVSIQVDNMWYEKIHMNIDFNLHELQNILHQASIYFSGLRNEFCPSEQVMRLWRRFQTFGLTERRLLRNQGACIEVELGLGKYKLHKSSIIIRPEGVSALYTEAPFLSIGRILVLEALFCRLGQQYPQYGLATRLQKRQGDHLLFIHFHRDGDTFSGKEIENIAETVCALFDSFELGGGITEGEARMFIREYVEKAGFIDFIIHMIRYHRNLRYSAYMGGGLEKNDICIYQSLLALMVMFPERFSFLAGTPDYMRLLNIMREALAKPEWKTDKYNLKQGWLENAYCMCLAILYPGRLAETIRQAPQTLPDPELCGLYSALSETDTFEL